MKVFRKYAALILALVTLSGVFRVPVAAASSKTNLVSQEAAYHVLELTKTVSPYAIMLDQGAKVSSLKSSRSRVASAGIETYDNISYIVVKPKRKGRTVVSFKYTYKKKTKKYRFTFRVVPYENPLRSLKIGSKGYAAKFRRNSYYALNGKVKGKVTVKAAKGWKVVDLAVEENGTFKSFAAGKKIRLKRGQALYITCYNGKRYTSLILECPEKEKSTASNSGTK